MRDDPYADAALYDLEYADHTEDIAYYVELAKRVAGPVLELGCGTGRLTLPMARAGTHVDGVDLAPGMLEGLRLKLSVEPAPVANRIRFFEADFQHLPAHLRDDYRAILWPFNALHHCPDGEAVTQTLLALKERLAPGGLLALDVYLPDRTLYDRDPEQTYEHRIFKDPRTGRRLHTWERGWWDESSMTHHVVYTYAHEDGREEHVHLKLRMHERPQLLQIFEDAGLTIIDSAEDFVGTPLRPKSLKWVLTLEPDP